MHGVATNNTTTTTTNNNPPGGNGNPSGNSAQVSNVIKNKTVNMMQQETANRDSYKQDTINYGINIRDTNSVMYKAEQQQRKLEMLESRFVPLNPQKVSV